MTTEADNAAILDVRPIIEAGEEPLELIVTTAAEIPDGGTLKLLVPFEPVPLYGVMAGKGFVSDTVEGDDGTWVVRFTRVALRGTSTVNETMERYPATTGVLARYEIDLCCGGHLSLEVAAKEHNVALNVLLDELTTAVRG